jgi:hypothetical protein
MKCFASVFLRKCPVFVMATFLFPRFCVTKFLICFFCSDHAKLSFWLIITIDVNLPSYFICAVFPLVPLCILIFCSFSTTFLILWRQTSVSKHVHLNPEKRCSIYSIIRFCALQCFGSVLSKTDCLEQSTTFSFTRIKMQLHACPIVTLLQSFQA